MKLAPRKRYTPEFKTQAVELRTPRRENTLLRQENDVLKRPLFSGAPDSRPTPPPDRRHPAGHRPRHPANLRHPPGPAQQLLPRRRAHAPQSKDCRLGDLIEAIFKRPCRRYGYRRIGDDLADMGEVCAPDRIRRIMRQRGPRAIQPKTYVPKISDDRADKPSPNPLLDKPLPAKPDEVWAGDITFIPTAAGWFYLAVVIDLCSRKIVGWALADHLRADRVIAALQQALGSRRALPCLIFHSDPGSQ